MKNIYVLIQYLVIVPMLVAAGTGLVRYRRLGRPQRLLLLLTLLSLAMEGVVSALAYHNQNNLFLAPIDTAIEFTLLALMYRLALRPSWLSRLIPGLLGAFLLGTAFSYTPRLDVAEFSPTQHTLEALLLLSFVGSYFYREIIRPVHSAGLKQDPMFWVSAGSLLYFAGSLLIFFSSNYVLHRSQALSLQVWTVHALLLGLLNVLFAVALACPPRKPWAGIT